MKALFSNALLKIQGIASVDPDNLAQHPPTPGNTPGAQGLTQPLVGAGANRFSHLPFGRGRPLRGSPQPHPRLTHTEAVGPSSYVPDGRSPRRNPVCKLGVIVVTRAADQIVGGKSTPEARAVVQQRRPRDPAIGNPPSPEAQPPPLE